MVLSLLSTLQTNIKTRIKFLPQNWKYSMPVLRLIFLWYHYPQIQTHLPLEGSHLTNLPIMHNTLLTDGINIDNKQRCLIT
jgi:hypothetical protein